MTQHATRASWKIEPFPDELAVVPYARSFTHFELSLLRRGFIPRAMEQKWFIFVEAHGENDVVFFHRSWTGQAVYQLHLERTSEGANATKLMAIPSIVSSGVSIVDDLVTHLLTRRR